MAARLGGQGLVGWQPWYQLLLSPTCPCPVSLMRDDPHFSRGAVRVAILGLSVATQRGQMPPPAQMSLKPLGPSPNFTSLRAKCVSGQEGTLPHLLLLGGCGAGTSGWYWPHSPQPTDRSWECG